MVLSATELQKAKKGDGHVPGRRARLCACPWRVTVKHEGEGGREGGMRTSGGRGPGRGNSKSVWLAQNERGEAAGRSQRALQAIATTLTFTAWEGFEQRSKTIWPFLQYNLHATKSPHFRRTIQWLSVNVQSYTTIPTLQFYISVIPRRYLMLVTCILKGSLWLLC